MDAVNAVSFHSQYRLRLLLLSCSEHSDTASPANPPRSVADDPANEAILPVISICISPRLQVLARELSLPPMHAVIEFLPYRSSFSAWR
jgi:hypothetical protein